MPPVPKKKHTRARSGKRARASAKVLHLPQLSRCPSCGRLKEPHKACPHCGFYK